VIQRPREIYDVLTLTFVQKSLKTEKERKKATAFPQRKYAVKA
jgi:hypothetical protein